MMRNATEQHFDHLKAAGTQPETMTCDVYGCRDSAQDTMTWPDGTSINLCQSDSSAHRKIAGPHMAFEEAR